MFHKRAIALTLQQALPRLSTIVRLFYHTDYPRVRQKSHEICCQSKEGAQFLEICRPRPISIKLDPKWPLRAAKTGSEEENLNIRVAKHPRLPC